MCGIAGYVLREGAAEQSVVRAMCDQIRHRGPDDEGYYTAGPCALGMRRLSIIDLATGHQPITNEDQTIWVVFNGEIYNFQSLRADLIARGHRFTTSSDTETLVHLYEQEGAEGLRRLRGMFAFAMWDARRRELFLARDRFGKKPLYFAALPHGLYFASEISALREAGVPLEPDRDALRLYFQFNYVPEPLSAFTAIRKVASGGWLSYREGTVREGRYWRLPAPGAGPAPSSEEEAAAQLRDKFDESVRIRMIADVPLGAFLSGGIDSSCVVASMARQSSEPVKTFSIGFEEAEFNELHFASQVARQYGTDHHEILVRPNSVDLVEKLARHFGEPLADTAAIPTYIMSEFAAREVKVALSGDGGDELFAGYESFAQIDRQRIYDRVPQLARRLLAWASERLPYSAYGKNYIRMISRSTALERYFEANTAPYFLRRALLQPDWMMPADAGFLMHSLTDCLPPGDADVLTQALYFEATAKLTGDMLVKVDRMSMAASLEVRCPLLDHELAELVAPWPHSWKMRGGKGKRILLEALGSRLPAAILNRAKMGFGVPVGAWFRGELREFLRDHLTSARFRSRCIVSPDFVEILMAEHETGRRSNEQWLWSLLMLELWLDTLSETASVSAAPHP